MKPTYEDSGNDRREAEEGMNVVEPSYIGTEKVSEHFLEMEGKFNRLKSGGPEYLILALALSSVRVPHL